MLQINTVPHFVLWAFFYPFCTDHFQGAAHRFQLFRRWLPPDNQPTATLRNSFLLAQALCISREGVPVTDDDGDRLSQLAGNLIDHVFPPTANDRCPVHVVSAEPVVQLHDAVFLNGYRTASGAVFLSGFRDVLFPVHLLRSFAGTRQRSSAEGLRPSNPDSGCWSF